MILNIHGSFLLLRNCCEDQISNLELYSSSKYSEVLPQQILNGMPRHFNTRQPVAWLSLSSQTHCSHRTTIDGTVLLSCT